MADMPVHMQKLAQKSHMNLPCFGQETIKFSGETGFRTEQTSKGVNAVRLLSHPFCSFRDYPY